MMLDTTTIKRLKRRATSHRFDKQLRGLLQIATELAAKDRMLQVAISKQRKKEGYVSAYFMREKIHQEYYHANKPQYHQGGTTFRRQLNQAFRAKNRQIIQKMKQAGFEEEISFPRWCRNFRWLYW